MKDVQDFYIKNLRILLIEIKEDLKNGTEGHIHKPEDSISLRYPFPPVFRFNASHTKNPEDSFIEIYKLIKNLLWKFKEHVIAKTTLQKKNKVGGLILPDFKT